MKRILLLSLHIFFASAAYGSTLTSDEVMTYLSSYGSQATREKYFACWDTEKEKALGYAKVETGNEKWLKIAAELLRDSDACFSMGLQTSIARALMNKPENVLPLVDSGRNLDAAYICVPFMADEEDPRILRDQLNTLNKLERALKSVKNLKLQTQRDKCLLKVLPLQKDIKGSLLQHLDGKS